MTILPGVDVVFFRGFSILTTSPLFTASQPRNSSIADSSSSTVIYRRFLGKISAQLHTFIMHAD